MSTYRRSIFLINRPFQLRFSFYVVSWLVALSFVYPMIVYTVFDYFFRIAALDPMGPPLTALKSTRQEILTLLAALQVIFLGFTFLISIFMSHRIAGPLFKLTQFFTKVKEGNYKEPLFFRKKDHFQDLAVEFNEMTQGIVFQIKDTVDGLTVVQSELQSALASSDSASRAKIDSALQKLNKVLEANQSKIP
jgi:methyl-accepting chemotaxis protein